MNRAYLSYRLDVSAAPRISPDLVWRLLDDDALLVSAHAGEFRILRGVDSVIWHLLLEQRSVEDIRHYLVEQCLTSPERAQVELERFLSELSAEGILIW